MNYDTLNFKLPHGQMTIYNNQFFPCSQAQFNKLFRIIRQHWGNNLDRIKFELNTHFEDRLAVLAEEKEVNAAAYRRQMQAWAEYRDIVNDEKMPNGVPLTKEQIKKYRTLRNGARQDASAYERQFKKNVREIEGLKKNLEMLKQVV